MLKMARKFESENPLGNAEKISAICRGGIVLLCGHVEGYIKDLGELELTNIYEKEFVNQSPPPFFSLLCVKGPC